jgi:hypothetical protein
MAGFEKMTDGLGTGQLLGVSVPFAGTGRP